MLPTDLSTDAGYFVLGITSLLLLFAGFLYYWMLRLANYCRAAVEYVQRENKRAVSLRRIAEIEATLTELSDSYDALLTSHRKLRARIGMRQHRGNGKKPVDSDAAPQNEQDRAAYKARLRDEAKRKGYLR